ncbi:MAG: LCP family protein [Nocardioidaceae bacterium]
MDQSNPAKGPKRRRRRRVFKMLGIAVVLVLVAGIGAALWLQHSLGNQIERLPSALPTNKDRPKPTSGKALNILLLGSDKRADGSVAGQRSDTMMVLHIASDRKSASLVSIPRDSWVDIPGHGKAKINAGFSWGGPALAVQTVEQLTDVRMDHVAVIDWAGFKALTNALGGVDITIPKTVTNSYTGKTWEAGSYHMDGATALDYVRQRAGLPGGDFDRIKRQQNLMRALMSKTLTAGTLTNPVKLYDVLDAVTSNLAVDEDWSTSQMRNLAFSLRGLRSGDVHFTTVPLRGLGTEGAQSVVYLDLPAGKELWQAVRADKAAQWIEKNHAGLGAEVS